MTDYDELVRELVRELVDERDEAVCLLAQARADLSETKDVWLDAETRAQKAEAGLAAARAALRYFAGSLSEFHGEEHHEDGCPDCEAMIEHAPAIAAARAEGGE